MDGSRRLIDQASVYHGVSKAVQLKNAAKLLSYFSIKKGDRVLDIGCGTGLLDEVIAEMIGPAGHLTAFDPDAERLNLAISLLKGYGNVELHVCRSNEFPVEEGKLYDSAFSNMVYHWVDDKEKIESFTRVYQSLRPGGVFAASYPLVIPLNIRRFVNFYSRKDPEFQCLFEYAVASCFLPVSLEWIQVQLAKIGFSDITTERCDEIFGLATELDFINWCQSTFANTPLGQFNYMAMYEDLVSHDPLHRLESGDVDLSYSSGYFVARKPSEAANFSTVT